MRNETLKYLYWVLGGTVLVLFLVGLAAFRNLNQAQEYGKLVNHTTRVLLKAEETLSLVKDAETGARGYLITHDIEFLKPYSVASLKVWPAIRSLDTLTVDNPRQRSSIGRLDSLTKKRLDFMKRSISIAVATNKLDSLKETMLGGKVAMDSIRSVIKGIQQEEQKLLAKRQKRENELDALTPFWLGLISLLAVGLFSASFFAVIMELRRRWHYENQLEQAVDNLKKTNAELENFVYLTTHHFQEPLRKLQTFSDRLRGKYQRNLPEDAGFMLERVHYSAARMQQLMEDLLLYLRLSGQSSLKEFKETNLLSLIQRAETAQRTKGKYAQVSTLEIAVDPTITVAGNSEQLQTLFEQLLDNSLKFVRQNIQSKIKIRTFVIFGKDIPYVSKEQMESQFCKIAFSDNGIGFDTAYTEKIFQLFQRLHHTYEYSGTGIGLAICKKVVTNHHGYLNVESQIGIGTTFYIYLPISG